VDLWKHAFFEGKMVPLSDAKISTAAHTFRCGTAALGGYAAHWNAEEKKPFLSSRSTTFGGCYTRCLQAF
jgi:hypothetical protein